MNLTLEMLIDFAREMEQENPIDWDNINLDPEVTYRMLGASIAEMVQGLNNDQRDVVLLASVLRLTVENFVLQLKLKQNDK